MKLSLCNVPKNYGNKTLTLSFSFLLFLSLKQKSCIQSKKIQCWQADIDDWLFTFPTKQLQVRETCSNVIKLSELGAVHWLGCTAQETPDQTIIAVWTFNRVVGLFRLFQFPPAHRVWTKKTLNCMSDVRSTC